MSSILLETLYKFLHLFIELSILFIGITFLVQIIQQKLSQEKIQSLLGGKKGIRGYVIAVLLGSVTPFCTCSTIPMLKGLIRAKAGFGTMMTFLFTSPLLNPIIVSLFLAMLGIKLTSLYVVIALTFSLTASVLLEKWHFERFLILDNNENKLSPLSSLSTISFSATSPLRPAVEAQSVEPCCATPKQQPAVGACCCSTDTKPAVGACCGGNDKRKFDFMTSLKEAWRDYLNILPHVVISCAIGAYIHGNIPSELLQKYIGQDNLLSIPLAAVIGIPLYVRTSVLIPLSSVLLEKGVSLGAMMALIIGGGGASLPELILLKSLFKKELMIAFVVVIFTMAISTGYATLMLI